MKAPSKDIMLLAIGQALTGTIVSMLITVSSLSGALLAPKTSLSTVPVTTTIIGTLVMIYPASWIMGALGRRNGFMIKAGLGIVGGIVCALGLFTTQFMTLAAGTFILGLFIAFGQYYRFAAIDATNDPSEHTRALAIVQGAGVLGGITGPLLSSSTASIFTTPYAGAFLTIALTSILLAISQLFLTADLGLQKKTSIKETPVTSHRVICKDFIYASILCMIAYAVMTLSMNAAPLSIQQSDFSLADTSITMQAHFIMMFLPSFFTPMVVSSLGLRGVIFVGILASTTGCLLALLPEQTLPLYIVELGLSGFGWCFMFNGGTLLLTKTYSVAMKDKAQGINSLLVYCGNIIASFSSGYVLFTYGWDMVNLLCLPLLLISCFVLFYKVRKIA